MTIIDCDTMFNESVEKLKETGVRITPQRKAVLEYLIETETHPTADEIFKALSHNHKNMSVATVYNNLKLFKEVGLVTELTYGDASSRFDFKTSPHYHVICKDCGKIMDFQYPALEEVEELASLLTGMEVDGHRLELYGRCRTCNKKED